MKVSSIFLYPFEFLFVIFKETGSFMEQTSVSTSTLASTPSSILDGLTKTIYLLGIRVECIYHPNSIPCPMVEIHCFDEDSDCDIPFYSDNIPLYSLDVFMDTTLLSHHIRTYSDIVRHLSWNN